MSTQSFVAPGAAALALAACSFSGREEAPVTEKQLNPPATVASALPGGDVWGDGSLFIPGSKVGPNDARVTCALPWVPEREARPSGTTCVLPGTDAPAWPTPAINTTAPEHGLKE